MRIVTSLAFAVLLLPATASVHAQCVNDAQPSCGVYQSCFAKLCPCADSPHEYFISYGEKNCKRFLELPGLSVDGKKWRDSTLRCLQETIVPALPADGKEATCNCSSMQQLAYSSHVQCYTQEAASICSLSCADWAKIGLAVDASDGIFDANGSRQMIDVARKCQVWPSAQKCVVETATAIIEKLK